MNPKVRIALIVISMLVLMFSGLVLGRVVSVGDARLGILFFGGIFGLLLLGMPMVSMWLCVLSTLTFCGVIVYNTDGLDSVWWGSYVLGASLFVPAFFQLIKRRRGKHVGSGLAGPVTFFMALFFLSAFINMIEPMQLLVSVKVWLLLAGIFAFLSMVPLREEQFKNLIKGVFAIALIQIVPVLYQFIFIKAQLVTMGLSTLSSDSVVGTFGGSPTSGGMTGALGAFLVINLVMLLSARRYGQVGSRFWLYLALLFMPMLMIEVKALFVYLPVAIFVLYKDLFVSKPFQFLKIGLSGILLIGVMLFAYQSYHWSSKQGGMMSNLEHMFSYSFASSAGAQQEEGVMTRVEVITFWWESHTIADPASLLFGHGPSSSKTGGAETGNIAEKYKPKEIDRTGLALILWDFGVIGFVAITWFFIAAYKLAKRLRKRFSGKAWELSLVHGIQAVVSIFFLAMLYRNDIPYAPPMMLGLMLTVGVLMQLHISSGVRGG